MATCVTAWPWMWATPWTLSRNAGIGFAAPVRASPAPWASFPKPIYTSRICRRSIRSWPSARKCCANGPRSGSVSMWQVYALNRLNHLYYIKHFLHRIVRLTSSRRCAKSCTPYWIVGESCWAPPWLRIRRPNSKWLWSPKLIGAIGEWRI